MARKNQAGCGCCDDPSFPPECCSGTPYTLQYPYDDDVGKPKEDFIENLQIDAGSFWGTFDQDTRSSVGFGCNFLVEGNLTGGTNGDRTATATVGWDAVNRQWTAQVTFPNITASACSSDSFAVTAVDYSGAIDLKNLSAVSIGSMNITGGEQCLGCCNSTWAFRIERDLIEDCTINVRDDGSAAHELVYHDEVSTNDAITPCECEFEMWDNTTAQSAGTWTATYNDTNNRWELSGTLPDTGNEYEDDFEGHTIGDLATDIGWSDHSGSGDMPEVADVDSSYRLGIYSGGGTRAIERTFSNPGDFAYDWNAANLNADYLRVYVNGTLEATHTSNGTPSSGSVTVPTGGTVRLEFESDTGDVYIDNIVLARDRDVTFIADDNSDPSGGDIQPGSLGDYTWGNVADGTAEVTGQYYAACP